MSDCPLCGSAAFASVLDRARVPILQNAPAPTVLAARNALRGDIALVACTSCGFVFNRAFDPGIVEYAEDYDNTQACSPQFEAYLHELASRLVERYALRGNTIVEVGCGKGQFLRLLCRLGGNRGYGFDPTYLGPEMVDDGAVTFVRELYSERHAISGTDFVCCRHVLEHVPDPHSLLASVRSAIGGNSAVPVFFEVPTVDWIVRNTCFWDVFYEHRSYFSAETLRLAFESTGFEVESISPAFGDQYLWLHARPGQHRSRFEGVTAALMGATAFRDRVRAQLADLRATFESLAPQGVAIWGAGAKGVTLANELDPDATLVRYVVDINPRKQGGFIPGTGHPIVAPDELGRSRVATVFGMNPNYRDEIEKAIARFGDIDVRWM